MIFGPPGIGRSSEPYSKAVTEYYSQETGRDNHLCSLTWAVCFPDDLQILKMLAIPILLSNVNESVQSIAAVKTEIRQEAVFEARFLHVLCRSPGASGDVRGALILSKSTLTFVSEQNYRLEIPVGSITEIKGKRAFYKPSVELQWDEGVITHSVAFFQDDSHQGKFESILSIPKLIELFRWESQSVH
jgi:hypothetical protein